MNELYTPPKDIRLWDKAEKIRKKKEENQKLYETAKREVEGWPNWKKEYTHYF